MKFNDAGIKTLQYMLDHPMDDIRPIELEAHVLIQKVMSSGNWYMFSQNINDLIDYNWYDIFTPKQRHKLMHANKHIEHGCFIKKGNGKNGDTYTFYEITKENHLYIKMFECRSGFAVIPILLCEVDMNVDIDNITEEHLSPIMANNTDAYYINYKGEDKQSVHNAIINSIINRVIFKLYVDVETVTVSKDNPKNKLNKIKYYNKSKTPITIIDTSWFRTIHKTDAFGVSGHVRLQPCGRGRKEIKLIYIPPYVKNGYSRTAKKELLKEEVQ